MIILLQFLAAWGIIFAICIIVLSLGSEYRMGFIDEQLSNKKVNIQNLKPYAKAFYEMTSHAIGSRFMWYSITYPWIRHRATTTSKKFKFMMWLNCLWFWSFFSFVVFAYSARHLGFL